MFNKTLLLLVAFFLIHHDSIAIVEKDDAPWVVKPRIDNEYEAPFQKKFPDGYFFLNLGPTGIRAKLTSAAPDRFEVMYVFEDKFSPAKGKVKAGEFIIGANGKKFKGEHIFGRRGNRKGWDGPLAELAKHIEDSQASDGKLELLLQSNKGDKRKAEIQLKVRGSFGPNFPWDCARSEALGEQLTDFIADEYKKRNGKLGRTHVNSHSILALMAHGNHDDIVKKHMSALSQKKYNPTPPGFATWSWGFEGVLMGEYTHSYKSSKMKTAMKSLSDVFRHGSLQKNGEISGHFTHRSQATLTKMQTRPYASDSKVASALHQECSLKILEAIPLESWFSLTSEEIWR